MVITSQAGGKLENVCKTGINVHADHGAFESIWHVENKYLQMNVKHA